MSVEYPIIYPFSHRGDYGTGFTDGHKKKRERLSGESLPSVGVFLDLVDFFSLAELNLWWQWHGFWYYYLPVAWKCFAQVGLDGSG